MLCHSFDTKTIAAKQFSKQIQNIFKANVNTSSIDCKYYCDENMNKNSKLKEPQKLSVISINARFLSKNRTTLIDTFVVDFDIILISEIWKTNIEFFGKKLPRYTFIYEPQKTSHFRGVGIFHITEYKV